jgi:hypothetical protein
MSGLPRASVSPTAFLKAPRASFAKRAFACTDVSESGILSASPSSPSSPPSAASSASLCALRLARSAAVCRACLDLSRGKVLLLLLFRCLLLRPLPGEVGCRARLNFASRQPEVRTEVVKDKALPDLEGHKSRASHVCWSHFCANRGLEKAAPAGARASSCHALVMLLLPRTAHSAPQRALLQPRARASPRAACARARSSPCRSCVSPRWP